MLTEDLLPKLADEPARLAALRRYEILDTAPEQEFDQVVSLVKAIFAVPMAFVSLVDADRQWLKAASGAPRGETPRSLTFCDQTIRSVRPLAVEDASQDPRFAQNPFVLPEGGIRCYLGAPLTTPDGYNVGTLCVVGTEARTFTAADGEILAGFAKLVVSQLEMRMLARRDALTGALTRRAFEEDLRLAARESWAPMALVLLEIDHFKVDNDRFGHPAGDKVLQHVAWLIQDILRPTDRFGRLGGEEFAILMRETTPGDALTLAGHVRGAVAALRLPVLNGDHVTLSAGLAPWRPEHRDCAAWIAAADMALYAAKRSGRNRVVVAQPTAPSWSSDRMCSAAPLKAATRPAA